MAKHLSVLLSVFHVCCGANILAFIPSPSFSHQVAFRELWKELSLRGHKITLATTDPINDLNYRNITEIDLSSTYNALAKYVFEEQAHKGLTMWNVRPYFLDMFTEALDQQLAFPEIDTLVNESDKFHFDLVMIEMYFPELIAFKKLYKCPVILMGTIGSPIEMYHAFGDTAHPVLNPDMNVPFAGILSFKERLISTLFYFHHKLFEYTALASKKQQIFDRYFGKVLSCRVEDLISDTDLVLLNESPLFKGIRALGPSTVLAGGSPHLKPLKPLPEVMIIIS